MTKERDFISGAATAIPIVIGYLAVGLPLGILAAKIGLSIWAIALLSFFIFAGSAQYAAVQLLAIGSGFGPIVITTFILNLRHFLMGMSLGSALPKVNLPLTAYLAHSITDETYGINIVKTGSETGIHPMNMLGTNVVAHASWIFATCMGGIIGNVIPIGPEYTSGALPIMFSVLLALQLKQATHYILAIITIAITIALIRIVPGNWPFLIAALIGPTILTVYETTGK